ncbi:MAG TPA: signal peptide peptidase SppA [Thermoanaerobaculia bacterium]|nr:signal peptide peptidase SppA [Thermoanaerobaculia bacterium]
MAELEHPTAEPSSNGAAAAPPVYTPPPPPPRAKSRAGMFFFGAFSGCALVMIGFFFLVALAFAGDDDPEFTFASEKVAIVPIEGEILDARETLDLLHKYARNKTVKAVVVRINSPGGAIAPSQEIYSAIRKIRADGKPVIASLDSVAASGGYYIASACDPIIANSGTITGSIGVILQWFDMKELVSWAKLKPNTITSGALKDAGSPFRELSEGERQYFQNIVTQLHTQFVRDVAEGRKNKMKAEDVSRVADGRIFTGEQALGLKLVDRIGTIDDAVRAAGEAGGIKGEPARVWPRRREGSLLDLLTAEESASTVLERIVSRRVPQFQYRW